MCLRCFSKSLCKYFSSRSSSSLEKQDHIQFEKTVDQLPIDVHRPQNFANVRFVELPYIHAYTVFTDEGLLLEAFQVRTLLYLT